MTRCNLSRASSLYIDPEPEDAISRRSSSDRSNLSLLEQYQCEYIRNRLEWQRCWPQRRMSNCHPGSLKGVIFLYHGYSACPDQYNDLELKLQNDCWHVYQILTVGHGFNYCSSNTSDSECTSSMYNLTALPNTRGPYITFTEMILDIISDEVSIIKTCEFSVDSVSASPLEVVVGGLSFGAPLVTATEVHSSNDVAILRNLCSRRRRSST